MVPKNERPLEHQHFFAIEYINMTIIMITALIIVIFFHYSHKTAIVIIKMGIAAKQKH